MSSTLKTQRTLACILCQQRKVKCDRTFPCANCVRQNAQCVPATAARRRRRRFPERDLLARLQQYEDLLSKNSIKFEPLHSTPKPDESEDSEEHASPAAKSESNYGPRYLLDSSSTSLMDGLRLLTIRNVIDAMSESFRDSSGAKDGSLADGVKEVIHRGWDNYGSGDNVLLGARGDPVDLATLHPDPVHMFRLWQMYLDNVNPLLKVTHTPTLQGRIVEGATNLDKVSPVLEALMFGIYAMAVETCSPSDCESVFSISKSDLLTRYQFACQQALLNCNFMRSSDLECLTAFFLYLASLRTTTAPASLSALCGIAVRIAQRLGLDIEATNVACSPFEAEMRRRLWWALVLYDARVTELASGKTSILAPTWDCKVPSNVSDADLRPEMKTAPVAASSRPTDSIFAVVRSQLAEFTMHSASFLTLTNPVLKPIAKDFPHARNIAGIEKTLEDSYLRYCDLETPLHLVTVWFARGNFAKARLLEHYASGHRDRDTSMGLAMRVLECDTQIVGSLAAQHLQWLPRTYFPFPAYIHIVQDLRARPLSAVADKAWEVMSDNYEALAEKASLDDKSPFRKFSQVVLLAWDARKEALGKPEEEVSPPRIIGIIRRKLQELAELEQARLGSGTPADSLTDYSAPSSMSLDAPTLGLDFGMGDSLMSGLQPQPFGPSFGWPPVPWQQQGWQ